MRPRDVGTVQIVAAVVMAVCSLLMFGNANRMAAIDWSLVPSAERAMWVTFALAVAMMIAAWAFLLAGLRKRAR